jgi:hypothetical protein
MIQSIFITNDNRLVTISEHGTEEGFFRRCPFIECGHYHWDLLDICPTTKKSIADELRRQKEITERKERAWDARMVYYKKHLNGWKNNWRIMAAAFFLLAIMFAEKARIIIFNNLLPVVFITLLVWFVWECWRRSRHEKQAEKIYERILDGEEVTVD